jgi:hypothetical protein
MKTEIITTVFLVSALLTSALAQDNEVPQQVTEQLINSPGGFGHLEFVKEIKIDFAIKTNTKVTTVLPIGKGKGFRACDGVANPDGAMAVSNAGTIIVANNEGIEYRNIKGDTLAKKQNWYQLLYDSSYFKNLNIDTFKVFDPKIIYDNLKDRFILVVDSSNKCNTMLRF